MLTSFLLYKLVLQESLILGKNCSVYGVCEMFIIFRMCNILSRKEKRLIAPFVTFKPACVRSFISSAFRGVKARWTLILKSVLY